MGLTRWFAQLLTRLLPADLRGEFGEEIVTIIVVRSQESRGVARKIASVLRALFDLVIQASAERIGRVKQHLVRWVDSLGPERAEVIWAFRSFRRSAASVVTVAAMIGLAAGANALLIDLAYRVVGGGTDTSQHTVRIWPGSVFSPYLLKRIEGASRDISQVAAVSVRLSTLISENTTEGVFAAAVAGDLFSVHQVQPIVGSLFDEAYEADALPLVISETLWRERWSADPSIVGRIVHFGYRTPGKAEVIGVVNGSSIPGPPGVQIWFPTDRATATWDVEADWSFSQAFAGVHDGVSRKSLEDALEVVAVELQRLRPDIAERVLPPHRTVVPTRWRGTTDTRWSLLVVGVSGVSVLLLALGTGRLVGGILERRRLKLNQIALALGSSNHGVTTYTITLWSITGIGAAAFAAVGAVGLRTLLAHTADRELLSQLQPGAATGIAVVAMTLAGLVVGITTVTGSIRRPPKRSVTSIAAGSASFSLTTALALTSVGIALGTMNARLTTLGSSFGFDVEKVVATRVSWTANAPAPDQSFLRSLRQHPAVEQAGMAHALPLSGERWSAMARLPGAPAREAQFWVVTPGFFETMGINVEDGRLFAGPRDSLPPAVVTANLAPLRGRSNALLGQPLTVGDAEEPVAKVVGTVGDIHDPSLGPTVAAGVFFEGESWPSRWRWLIVRGPERDSLEGLVSSHPGWVTAGESIALSDLGAQHRDRHRGFALLSLIAGLMSFVFSGLACWVLLHHCLHDQRSEMAVRRSLGATSRQTIGWAMRGFLPGLAVGAVVGVLALLGLSAWSTQSSTQISGYVLLLSVLFAVGAPLTIRPIFVAIEGHKPPVLPFT